MLGTPVTSLRDAPDDSRPPLPRSVAAAATWGPRALVAGVALMALALLTNPVPDPSYPWATLPASLRLPVTQPRVEHWPVSYTVGLWLVVFASPTVFLAAYRRVGRSSRWHPSLWLTAAPATYMLAATSYCRFWWPKPDPATWNAPSYTFVCWAYCSTYDPVWSNLAYAVVGVGAVAAWVALRDSPRSVRATAAFGVLALPLGLPVLYDAYRRSAA